MTTFTQISPNAGRREANKFATTNVTNELAEMIRGIMPTPLHGNGPILLAPDWEFIGVVVDAGPDDEADFVDNRYWVEPHFIKAGVLSKDRVDTGIDGKWFDRHPVPVTNLSEQSWDATTETAVAGSHGLAVGTYIAVHMRVDSEAEKGKLRWYTFSGGGNMPIGQYPGMVWVTVANNQNAMAYPFAVNTV